MDNTFFMPSVETLTTCQTFNAEVCYFIQLTTLDEHLDGCPVFFRQTVDALVLSIGQALSDQSLASNNENR